MRKNKRATAYYNTKTNKYAVVDNGRAKIYEVKRNGAGFVKMKHVRSYTIGSLTQDELIKMTERSV